MLGVNDKSTGLLPVYADSSSINRGSGSAGPEEEAPRIYSKCERTSCLAAKTSYIALVSIAATAAFVGACYLGYILVEENLTDPTLPYAIGGMVFVIPAVPLLVFSGGIVVWVIAANQCKNLCSQANCEN